MKCKIVPVFVCLFAAMSSAFVHAADGRSVPDFGLIWNNDGDLSFTGSTPEESVQRLRWMVDRLSGTPVRTLSFSVGAGSDILYYPTAVASTWGWRSLPDDPEPVRTAKAKAGTDAGIDSPRVAGEEARRLGIGFVPSLRMNDWHFAAKAMSDPLTSRFWMDNHDRLLIGKGNSPIDDPAAARECENLLNFMQQEVRDFRLAQIQEIIDRYKDIMVGVELDFNRVQVFFPRGQSKAGSPLMTELVREVRRRLDKASESTGRTYYLFVRVPPTLDNCAWAGVDVPGWLSERLVDVVIPAQLMTLSHDMPVDEFVRLAEPVGAKVYPAIYPRTGYYYPFEKNPGPSSFTAGPDSRASLPMICGAASNYWMMGASGFQIYNFGWPDDDYSYLVARSLARPQSLVRENRVYAVTPAYYLDKEDSYEYRKQVPVALQPDRRQVLTLMVGELSGAPDADRPDYVGLRIGFRGLERGQSLTVTFNGDVLHDGTVGDAVIETGVGGLRGGAVPDPATAYVQWPIHDLGMIRQGRQEIGIELQHQDDVHETVTISEVQLGVIYDKKLFSW